VTALGACTALTRLDLSRNGPRGAAAATLRAFSQLSHLRELNLNYNQLIVQGAEYGALASCTSLRVLELAGTKMPAGGVFALGQLVSVDVPMVQESLGLGLEALPSLSRLAALTRLDAFHEAPGTSAALLQSVSTLTTLRDLSFRSVSRNTGVVTHLAHLTELTALVWGTNFQINGEHVAALARFSGLQRLAIRTDHVAPKQWCLHGNTVLSLSQLPAIRCLEVHVHSLSAASSTQLAGMSRLTRLRLHIFHAHHAKLRPALAVLYAAPELECSWRICWN
jgi:hypothetical protein